MLFFTHIPSKEQTEKVDPGRTTLLLGGVFLFVLAILLAGCASSRYLLDEPVSDPIMTCDDQQDSDLAKVEDGGMAGSAGECPT